MIVIVSVESMTITMLLSNQLALHTPLPANRAPYPNSGTRIENGNGNCHRPRLAPFKADTERISKTAESAQI